MAICALAGLAPGWAGTLVQFRTGFGSIVVELYDQDKPVTVSNFLHYVQSGRFQNGIIHRCVPSFVIQGGGFFVNNIQTSPQIEPISVFGAIADEFNSGRRFSNLYGTIAMAKVSGNTNSATSQWFFNLTDNAFLDTADTNDLFAVFGHVVSGTNVLNVFNTFSSTAATNVVVDATQSLGDGNFAALPLRTPHLTVGDLIFVDISVLDPIKAQAKLGTNGTPVITWNTSTNAIYHLETATNLPPVWQTLTVTNGTGAVIQVTDTNRNSGQRFYRVSAGY